MPRSPESTSTMKNRTQAKKTGILQKKRLRRKQTCHLRKDQRRTSAITFVMIQLASMFALATDQVAFLQSPRRRRGFLPPKNCRTPLELTPTFLGPLVACQVPPPAQEDSQTAGGLPSAAPANAGSQHGANQANPSRWASLGSPQLKEPWQANQASASSKVSADWDGPGAAQWWQRDPWTAEDPWSSGRAEICGRGNYY